jgi:hypothetical protein
MFLSDLYIPPLWTIYTGYCFLYNCLHFNDFYYSHGMKADLLHLERSCFLEIQYSSFKAPVFQFHALDINGRKRNKEPCTFEYLAQVQTRLLAYRHYLT